MTETAFSRAIGGIRTVRILVGDTIQRIAARELDDAGRWPELIWLNDLSPPYIVATQAEATAQPGTLYYGQSLQVPAPRSAASAVVDPESVYGRDIELRRGMLKVANGDIGLLSGLPNLRQAIEHRLVTEPGELLYHPTYGCFVRASLGEKNTQTASLRARWFIDRALRDEPRLQSVSHMEVLVDGDAINLNVEVVPVAENTPTDLNLVII